MKIEFTQCPMQSLKNFSIWEKQVIKLFEIN